MLPARKRVRAIKKTKKEKKKTMSEDEKMTKEKCEAEGGTWNEEDSTCTPKAEEKATDLNLTQRIEKVIKDVLDVKLKALEATMDKKIEDILKSKEVEMEQALRKGFGLDNDPVIHQSDLIAAIRKASLETADTDKRTPPPEASVKSTGPEGNKSPNPFEEQLKQFEEAK